MSTRPEILRYRRGAGSGRRLGPKARETRQALLDALDALLETTAWHALAVRDVARLADASPATFCQYFPSLEDAVLELARTLERDGASLPKHLELVAGLLRFEQARSAVRP